MGEFFRGWKRKVGVLTLGLALVTMLGWVRSDIVSDFFEFLYGEEDHVMFISTNGILLWETWDNGDPSWGWVTIANSKMSSEALNFRTKKSRCPFGTNDIWVEDSLKTNGQNCRQRWISYWSIVIPLTIVSAFLFLSKPRKSTQTKIIEPVQVEGA